jgi:hypothetical protein
MPEIPGAIVPTSSSVDALPYPGRVVKQGEKNKGLVTSLQLRLNEVGCGPIDVDGDFGDQTENAVRLFQLRHPDSDGQPLKVDGEVGPLTWSRLFGTRTVPQVVTAEGLGAAVLDVARSQLHVRESPLGSNRGTEVDEYVRLTGLSPSGQFPWCVCFVFFCFHTAAKKLGRSNPMIKTAGVLDLWGKAGQQGVTRITNAKAKNNPSLVKPGHIFILDTGLPGGAGHAGLVEQVAGGKIVTIEGNTNNGGSRDGIGVFRRTARKIADINKGFVDFVS